MRLLLGAPKWLEIIQNGWKLATNELLSIKKKCQLQNSGGGGGGGDPSVPRPLYDTLPIVILNFDNDAAANYYTYMYV